MSSSMDTDMTPQQRPNFYNKKLPHLDLLHADADRYLGEIKLKLSQDVLVGNIEGCVTWTVNLHKYIILYGLRFSQDDHVRLIRVLFGLLTTKNTDPVSLDKFAKVLFALIKKKWLVPRSKLILEWRPLFELYEWWEDSSTSSRGLVKSQQGFKAQIKSIIKVCRGYFSVESTREMLELWRPMMCPKDRSMATAVKYFSLFLPTTKDIPPSDSWELWLPLFHSFWASWGNSPAWEVDLLRLYSRLSFHRIGEVPWDPLMPELYTRFMASFNLPVTYGGSGVHLKHGISGSHCLGAMAKWVVSTLGGGSQSQQHLTSLLRALHSYYYPANSNSSSELLHVFISCLCTYTVERLHQERHNTKWATKVPPDKRLTDTDVKMFVESVHDIAFLVLYNDYEEEARSVFQSLALLSPDTIIPPLLERLIQAKDSLTEPHRFHVCVQAMSACAGPLVRNYPEKAFDLLDYLLPGIDVNDIWKCTDIFVLMSDLLEMMPIADLTKENIQCDSDEKRLLVDRTAGFENFVVEFMNRCFTLIEHSRRETVRGDSAAADGYLNDEEIAADAAVNDTFLRMCVNCSPGMFKVIFNKLTSYLAGKIVEPTVAGGILAAMCKSVVQTDPVKGLEFFVPNLVRAITERIDERGDRSIDSIEQKIDEELQFNLQLLREVLEVKSSGIARSVGSHLLPYIEQICQSLDKSLHLLLKDEYELGQTTLECVLSWLTHIRLVEVGPRVELGLSWGKTCSLEEVSLDWYIPGPQELSVVSGIVSRYLGPALDTILRYSRGELALDKESLVREVRLVQRVVQGLSALLQPEAGQAEGEYVSVLANNLSWVRQLKVGLNEDQEGHLRAVVGKVMCQLQNKMCEDASDDTETYNAILGVYDVLLFHFGVDEDEIGDAIEDHKREKLHREDKLIRGKRHLAGVHLERITLQWETQMWLTNILTSGSMPRGILDQVLSLCIHRYSEVRMVAQDLALKIVGRVGKPCYSLILPFLTKCLAPPTSPQPDSENTDSPADYALKGALYLVSSEKHQWYYSWGMALQLWPALVNAQHCDKQSVDDLLRDIAVKMNRYYQDFCLYTLPLSAPSQPPWLCALARTLAPQGEESSKSLESTGAMSAQVHYQALESELITLLTSRTLHWRHEEMAVGMLLSMLAYDTLPSPSTTALWLELLTSDQRTLRLMAYQALEGILKLAKLKSKKVPLSDIVTQDLISSPRSLGVRPDNTFLQYQLATLSEGEVEAYWAKPFIVKSHIGYFDWPKDGTARVTYSPDDFKHSPDSVLGLIAKFFLSEDKVARFVELNSLEHEKGTDFFSTDRGLFLSFLLENLGPCLCPVLQPHIERLVQSPEESHQRAAAEMVYGCVRGARFWDFRSSRELWAWLTPVFQQVLSSVTSETQSDWDFCFSGASNKTDPNRLYWLYEMLVSGEHMEGGGAFKSASFLLFVGKCLSMQWRGRALFCRTYNLLRGHWAHPAASVRHQLAATLATLTTMQHSWTDPLTKENRQIGAGFPTKEMFVQEILPLLPLHSHNPEFPMSREESPNSSLSSNGGGLGSSSEDVSMVSVATTESGLGEVDTEEKVMNRRLEMVSLWVCHSIRLSSASLSPAMLELLPYFCQFIGTETDQDVSQACLQALCYLSASILPGDCIQPTLDMVKRVASSQSYKTKMSLLEFIQVVVFTNFPALVCSPSYSSQVLAQVLSLLQDPNITVRQKAAKVLGGLLHSRFIDGDAVTDLLTNLRSRIRTRMTKVKGSRKFRKSVPTIDNTPTTALTNGVQATAAEQKPDNVLHHSGILGLCAFAEAFPYCVPPFLPPILMELSTHLNDPVPTPQTIKKSLQEFKRTHQDNWQEHKTKFTEDQLVVMTDLLVSHNYYA